MTLSGQCDRRGVSENWESVEVYAGKLGRETAGAHKGFDEEADIWLAFSA